MRSTPGACRAAARRALGSRAGTALTNALGRRPPPPPHTPPPAAHAWPHNLPGTQVVRSADLLDYTAEEGVRVLGEGKMLVSDSFPGQQRNKLCMVSKVRGEGA